MPLFQEWRHALSGLLSSWGESPAVLAMRALRAVRDRDGRITDFVFLEANLSTCVFNQLPLEQLIGRSLIELQLFSLQTEMFRAFIQVLETGEPLILGDEMDPRQELGRSQRRYAMCVMPMGGMASTIPGAMSLNIRRTTSASWGHMNVLNCWPPMASTSCCASMITVSSAGRHRRSPHWG